LVGYENPRIFWLVDFNFLDFFEKIDFGAENQEKWI
jgi:hypothetical protein